MDFDDLILYFKRKATKIAVFGDKPSRTLRVVVRIAGYEFEETEWIEIDSELQPIIARQIFEKLDNTF